MDHTSPDWRIPAPLCRAVRAARAGVPRVPPRLTSAGLIAAGVRAELLESLALRRAISGRVAKSGDHYYDHGFALPSFLTQTCDELTEAGLLTLARDGWGMLRLGLSDAGRRRYAQLSPLHPGARPGRAASSADAAVRGAPGAQPVTRHPCADAGGIPIALFAQVELVAEDAEPTVLGSRLHQRGQVVGQGPGSVYVRFCDHQVISVRPQLLRVLDETGDGR